MKTQYPHTTHKQMHQLIHTSHKLQADIILITEHNLNPKIYSTIKHIKQIVSRTWQHHSISTTNTPDKFFTHYQPGAPCQ